MKSLTIAVLSLAILAGSHQISRVERDGSWVYMYDESGKKYQTLSANSVVGDVLGYSSTFFVSRNGNWIYLYDAEGKRYKTMSTGTVGDVIGVAGNTFTSRNGNWIYTWDKNGKKLNTRSAR